MPHKFASVLPGISLVIFTPLKETVLALGIEGIYVYRGLRSIAVFLKQHPLSDYPVIGLENSHSSVVFLLSIPDC